MIVHALAERPRECCGVLVGAAREIREAVPVANRSALADRFLLDPGGHIEVRREARQRGLEVLGFYHSHPRSPAAPSKRDRDEASYPGHLYLIVSLARDPVDLRGFQLEDGIFVEVPLVTVP
jgi:proteasome lid subunit RPN8/RPN11